MVSVKDIAKECGVSVATVSKALNGHSDISQATKEKVRAAAQRLGYMPNSAPDIVIDKGDIVTAAFRAALEGIQHCCEEFVGKTALRLVHKQNA